MTAIGIEFFLETMMNVCKEVDFLLDATENTDAVVGNLENLQEILRIDFNLMSGLAKLNQIIGYILSYKMINDK